MTTRANPKLSMINVEIASKRRRRGGSYISVAFKSKMDPFSLSSRNIFKHGEKYRKNRFHLRARRLNFPKAI